MFRQLVLHPRTRLIAGVATGLLGSAVSIVALMHFSGVFDQARLRALETRLLASAAHASGSLAVATGPIEAGLEGLFVLDSISGELTCGVLNPRTGQMGGIFRRNVAADLGVVQGKQPKYMLVTGNLEPKGTVSNTRPALSLVYVADANSGNYVGYMLPWNSAALNQNLTQFQPMIPIGGGSARTPAIEK
jgi:hypothetical protein